MRSVVGVDDATCAKAFRISYPQGLDVSRDAPRLKLQEAV